MRPAGQQAMTARIAAQNSGQRLGATVPARRIKVRPPHLAVTEGRSSVASHSSPLGGQFHHATRDVAVVRQIRAGWRLPSERGSSPYGRLASATRSRSACRTSISVARARSISWLSLTGGELPVALDLDDDDVDYDLWYVQDGSSAGPTARR